MFKYDRIEAVGAQKKKRPPSWSKAGALNDCYLVGESD
jgi:hypothetical protein